MDEDLTIGQIEARFQSEWVFVEEPQTNEALEVQSGTVRWHSKDRDQAMRTSRRFGCRSSQTPTVIRQIAPD